MKSLTSLAAATKGIDISNVVINVLAEREVDLSKIVSVIGDGARSTAELEKTLLFYLQIVLVIQFWGFITL